MKRFRSLAALIACLFIFAASAHAQEQAVDITLEQFGVGNAFRPGGYVGALLTLKSNLPEAGLPVWVQWEVPNADGDITEYYRLRTLNSNTPTPIWLTAWIPPSTDQNSVWTVRVFEEADGQRGRELGGARISPMSAQFVEPSKAMIGVIGTRSMRLNAYSASYGQLQRPVAAMEDVRVVEGIGFRDARFPDRWEALLCFEVIAWSDARPSDLLDDQADALRAYVQRGGHLIICLDPDDITAWGIGKPGAFLLEDLLPQQVPRRDENVMLSELLPIMSKASGAAVDFSMNIRVFKDLGESFDAIDNFYEPLIALPDGRVVVIQRTFGHGRITILGVDVSNQRLYSVPLSNGAIGLPQADVFWNRILGKRVDTPSSTELTALKDEERLASTRAVEMNFRGGRLFTDLISMSGPASQGLLLALFLFIAYWIVAGPGGFALLKMYKQSRHAWVVFAACAAVFTALAWGSVELIRPREINMHHVTFLDHIARPAGERPNDPQLQRAIGWMSLYLPRYRSTPIRIESDTDQRDLLASWTPSRDSQPFPNPDRYTVDVRRTQNEFRLPSRSTSTQLYGHFLGSADPDTWEMMHALAQDPVRIREVELPGESPLLGTIEHGLPGTLEDVLVIYVSNERLPARRYELDDQGAEQLRVRRLDSGRVLNRGSMWKPKSKSWEPHQRYNLLEELNIPPDRTGIQTSVDLERNLYDAYVKVYATEDLTGQFTSGVPLTSAETRRYLEMLSFFNQLTPPQYMKTPNTNEMSPNLAAYRELAREVDLSAWFTRPCLIVIGYLRESPSPIPLRVDGSDEAPVSEGLTIYRWIYPLPLDEAQAFPITEAEDES